MKRETKSTSYYPMFLMLKDKRCVVIGGGDIALRKVKMLLEFEASVDVISLSICPELEDLFGKNIIRFLKKKFEPSDLCKALIVIAATDDPKINHELAKASRNKSIPVNVVDDPVNSDFIVPSYFRRGDVTVAVSTGGKSPALARKIRSAIEDRFGNEYGRLTQLVSEVREEYKGRKSGIDNETWQNALNLEVLICLIKDGQYDEVKAALRKSLGTNSISKEME